MTLNPFGLSPRVANVLAYRAYVLTGKRRHELEPEDFQSAAASSDLQLLALRNVGKAALAEIRDKVPPIPVPEDEAILNLLKRARPVDCAVHTRWGGGRFDTECDARERTLMVTIEVILPSGRTERITLGTPMGDDVQFIETDARA